MAIRAIAPIVDPTINLVGARLLPPPLLIIGVVDISFFSTLKINTLRFAFLNK